MVFDGLADQALYLGSLHQHLSVRALPARSTRRHGHIDRILDVPSYMALSALQGNEVPVGAERSTRLYSALGGIQHGRDHEHGLGPGRHCASNTDRAEVANE